MRSMIKKANHLSAATALAMTTACALGAWGVRYEVNSGAGWTTDTTIDVSGGPKIVDFRIIVYHDGNTTATGAAGTFPAVAPLRLCNSQKVTNFGAPGLGDSLLSYAWTVVTGNAKSLARSQVGNDLILGTPNSVLSFAANITSIVPYPLELERQFYAGSIRVGNGSPAALSRTITLTANSFAFPNASSGSGGAYGASFYVLVNGTNAGYPVNEPGAVIPAVITVQLPCPADFDGNRIVDDADFVLFETAHGIGDCAAPEMEAGCPADLNGDDVVNDEDFVLFAAAYEALLCN